MKKLLFLVLLVGLAAAVLESPVLADKDDGEKGEQQISFKVLPGPVKGELKGRKVGQLVGQDGRADEDPHDLTDDKSSLRSSHRYCETLVGGL